MTLSQELCVPCQKDTPPLGAAEIDSLLRALPGWEVTGKNKAIHRRFTFKNYAQALAFVQQVSEIAEAARHHPDISFGWGYADILFTTHMIGGLHRNDFILASKVNRLA